METKTVETLEGAVDGLLYMSESDEPFEVVHWKGDGKPMDPEQLLQLTSCPPHTPVSVISVDDFFKDLTVDRKWYGDEERATAQRYRDLQNVIRQQLSDVRVFRVGEIQVDIYIIGVAQNGDWAGIKTRAIET